MKMLHVVCGKKIEEEIVGVFKEVGLKGYTVIAGVGGSGITGTVDASDPSGDGNTLFMAALDHESIFLPQILHALKMVRAKHLRGHHGEEIPLKVFLQPCEVIL